MALTLDHALVLGRDAAFCFALERHLIAQTTPGKGFVLLWNTPPTVMLGRYQNVLHEVDLSWVRAHDVTVVRRLSGGGAIYTDRDTLQLSYIVSSPDEGVTMTPFLTPMKRALSALGVTVQASGRNDLTLAGRKISGHAQYRQAGCVVHHGSLLVNTDLSALARALTVPSYKLASKGIASVRERVTTLTEAGVCTMALAPFADAFRAALMADPSPFAAGAAWTISDELERLVEPAAARMREDESLWRLDPPCALSCELPSSQGHVVLHLDIDHGAIVRATLEGDCFASGDVEAWLEHLKGVSLSHGLTDVGHVPIAGVDREALSGVFDGISRQRDTDATH